MAHQNTIFVESIGLATKQGAIGVLEWDDELKCYMLSPASGMLLSAADLLKIKDLMAEAKERYR